MSGDKVKRYGLVFPYVGDAYITLTDDGKYVLYSDFESLRSQVRRLIRASTADQRALLGLSEKLAAREEAHKREIRSLREAADEFALLMNCAKEERDAAEARALAAERNAESFRQSCTREGWEIIGGIVTAVGGKVMVSPHHMIDLGRCEVRMTQNPDLTITYSVHELDAALREGDPMRSDKGWLPIESAPKGGGAELVTDPAWVEPPRILLAFSGGEVAVGRWDWYYAEGGNGCTDGVAWVEPVSGELLHMYYDPPTHWMPLPEPPTGAGDSNG